MGRQWCINNKDRYRAYQRKFAQNWHFLRRYGISRVERDKMIQLQDNQCLICKISFNEIRYPQVDHDHKTNKIRGILCHKCNMMLGHATDNIDILKQAIDYLEMTK